MVRKTTEQFIEEARQVHGDKYDYSKVEYVNSATKVCIICPIHGEFWQRPNDHIRGIGCRKCSSERIKHLVAGVGLNDNNDNIKRGNSIDISYKKWSSMLHRCYDKKDKTYFDCVVCEDWLIYSNFKRWFKEHYIDDWDLDKDILVKGNKIYSPDTCCFVPQEINKTLTKTNATRGLLPIGVTVAKGNKYKKYRAQINFFEKRINLGCFHKVEDAFFVYKKHKEQHLKYLADKYKDRLEPRVYKALYNYQVEITD